MGACGNDTGRPEETKQRVLASFDKVKGSSRDGVENGEGWMELGKVQARVDVGCWPKKFSAE